MLTLSSFSTVDRKKTRVLLCGGGAGSLARFLHASSCDVLVKKLFYFI
jgi:spermidine synthase